jgi:hypothetical protein
VCTLNCGPCGDPRRESASKLNWVL